MLIAIRPSDGDVKAWRSPWCFSRRAGYESAPGLTLSLPFITLPHSTTQLHYTNSYTYSHPNLCSFCNLSVTSPTLQLILLPFRRFTYLTTAHYPTLPLLHLRYSSFSNPSVALPTSQLILQSFRCCTYVTAHSPTLLSLLLRYRLFTYVIRRVAHDFDLHLFVTIRHTRL